MARIWQFIKNLIKSDTAESSKRAIAIGSMTLVAYVVIRYTTKENTEVVLGELLSFVLVLSGVAVWQDVKKHRNGTDQPK